MGKRDAPHRRSCGHGCRWFRHGSAYGTKSSDLRACRALLGYLVLPGTIRLAFHSGIHPQLPQRRRVASSLPSPVDAVADGCTVPATRSALALGAAHARLSAVPQRPRYSTLPWWEVRWTPTGNGRMVHAYILPHGGPEVSVTFSRFRNTRRQPAVFFFFGMWIIDVR